MDDLIDMIIADESPSKISDTIKDMLFAKSAARVDATRPLVANGVFGEDDIQVEDEGELDVESSVDTEDSEEV